MFRVSRALCGASQPIKRIDRVRRGWILGEERFEEPCGLRLPLDIGNPGDAPLCRRGVLSPGESFERALIVRGGPVAIEIHPIIIASRKNAVFVPPALRILGLKSAESAEHFLFALLCAPGLGKSVKALGVEFGIAEC